jgi:hypothetical protein
MKKQTRSLLEEINSIVPAKDKHSVVESRATQVIASVSNLVRLIETSYAEPERSELIKRLFNSMKSGDERKFIRGIRIIKESKKNEATPTKKPGQ